MKGWRASRISNLQKTFLLRFLSTLVSFCLLLIHLFTYFSPPFHIVRGTFHLLEQLLCKTFLWNLGPVEIAIIRTRHHKCMGVCGWQLLCLTLGVIIIKKGFFRQINFNRKDFAIYKIIYPFYNFDMALNANVVKFKL